MTTILSRTRNSQKQWIWLGCVGLISNWHASIWCSLLFGEGCIYVGVENAICVMIYSQALVESCMVWFLAEYPCGQFLYWPGLKWSRMPTMTLMTLWWNMPMECVLYVLNGNLNGKWGPFHPQRLALILGPGLLITSIEIIEDVISLPCPNFSGG